MLTALLWTLALLLIILPGLQEAAGKRLDEVLLPSEVRNVGKMSAKRCEADEKEGKTKQEWQDSNPRPAVLETAALPD